MNVLATARPSIRVRWSWTVRLMRMALRRRRVATIAGCSAFALATLALFTCGPYLSGSAVEVHHSASSSGTVELVAFLRDDLPTSSRDGLSAVLRRLPGVGAVKLLGSDEALERMRTELGDRAAVLDGVEEGFLPATLEVTLAPGPDGARRADALAWRLRRMEGIAEVDVLRSGADQRLADAQATGRRFRQLSLAAALAAVALALCLAGLALRRAPGEARLLAGFGFTGWAISVPGALAGALCALVGAALGAGISAAAAPLARGWWVLAPLREGSFGGLATRWGIAAVVTFVVLCGATLGWWGARSGLREANDLEAQV